MATCWLLEEHEDHLLLITTRVYNRNSVQMSTRALQEAAVLAAKLQMSDSSSFTVDSLIMAFIPRRSSVDVVEASSLARPASRLRMVGGGNCGSVWANPDSAQGSTDAVIKLDDGGPGLSLTKDFHVHGLIATFLSRMSHCYFSSEVRINFPLNPIWLAANNNQVWNMLLPNFPPGIKPCNALISERIPRWPRVTRVRLVRDFCFKPLQVEIMADKRNADCLLRPYLGRRRPQLSNGTALRYDDFSIRNFPLHADQIEALGLSLERYARAMAEALAFLHWVVALDAAGIEFVLAPDRAEPNPKGSLGSGEVYKNKYLGDHCLWVLDFDRCSPVDKNDHGVDMAVKAFYLNAPFYPKPGTGDKADDVRKDSDKMVWLVFRDHYLMMSENFVRGHGADVEKLPALFITQVELRLREFLPRK